MKTLNPVPTADNPTTIMADRRKAAQAAQRSATPPIVPRANPPTTMAEVPPGIAPFRAVPARTLDDGGSATHVPKDSTGEIRVPVEKPSLLDEAKQGMGVDQ